MNIIVNDILVIIFNYIQKITDKRAFLMTCTTINTATKNEIIIAKQKFNKQYNGIYKNICPENFIVEMYYDNYIKINENEYEKIISKRSIYLRGTRLSIHIKMIIAANNLQLLKLAIDNGYNVGLDPSIIDFAVLLGHLDILKYLHTIRRCFANTYTIDLAAASGHLEVVKWIQVEKKYGTTPQNLYSAAKNGHLDILKYFMQIRYRSNYLNEIKFCNKAAKTWTFGYFNMG